MGHQKEPPRPPATLSIDEEFAALEQEIDRITALPPSGVRDMTGVLSALQALKLEWDKRAESRFDQPVWRRRIDQALATALGKVLQAGQTVDRHGNLGFHLEGDAVAKYGTPVVGAVLDGLEQQFLDKWVKQPADPANPKAVEPADIGGVLSLLLRDKLKK